MYLCVGLRFRLGDFSTLFFFDSGIIEGGGGRKE